VNSHTDDERVDAFLRVGDAILARRAIQSGLETSMAIRFRQGEGLTIESREPDLEDYRSLWVDLRKLVLLQDSVVFFPNVMNSARWVFSSSDAGADFEKLRDAWNQALSRSAIGFSFNSHVWTPRELIDVWLNGEVFHDDSIKRSSFAELERFSPVIPRQIIYIATARLLEVMMRAMARIDFLKGGSGVFSIAEGRHPNT